jgi:hypothetical protein
VFALAAKTSALPRLFTGCNNSNHYAIHCQSASGSGLAKPLPRPLSYKLKHNCWAMVNQQHGQAEKRNGGRSRQATAGIAALFRNSSPIKIAAELPGRPGSAAVEAFFFETA